MENYIYDPKGEESPNSLGNTSLCLDLLYYVMGYGQNVEKENRPPL